MTEKVQSAARALRRSACWLFPLAAATLLFVTAHARADTVELLSGIRINGRITSKTATTVTVESKIGSRTIRRSIPVRTIHAVTIGNKLQVLNEKPGAEPSGGTSSNADPPPAGAGTTGTAPAASAGTVRRSRAEVEKLIREVGSSKPDWYDDTPLDYPQTLDLSFPQPPPKGWNNQKNVGQFVWDIINPNPGRWHQGVRFLHHLLLVNKDNQETKLRVMNMLGAKYHNLLGDYARAAFWWQQSGADDPRSRFPVSSVHLAECYWRLGNKQMAVQLLEKLPTYYPSIKLWADMGETRKAVQIANGAVVARGGEPHICYLLAGDALRLEGQYQQAIDYYQKVLDYRPADQRAADRAKRNQDRARANIEAIRLFELSDVRKVADGTYRAKSLGYQGDVHVEVTVRGHRIEDVHVTRHSEKQFYSAVTDTPRRIIEKQGVQGVDTTSSATITSEAIINATAKALASGAK